MRGLHLGLVLFSAVGSSFASLEEDESVLMALQPARLILEGEAAEKQLPDFGKMAGDAMKNMKVPDVGKAAQDAMKTVTDTAMKMATDGGAKMNETLDMVGKKVQTLNKTALKYVKVMQDKVGKADATEKAKVFQSTLKDLLQQVSTQFNAVHSQVKGATTMAVKSLETLGQGKAAEKLDGEFEKMLTTSDSWTAALKKALASLSAKVPAAGLIEEEHTQDPKALASSLSKQLKEPLGQLKTAAGKLEELGSQASASFGTFVASATAAAKEKQLPAKMVSEVTEMLQGVQAKAGEELKPLGSIATGLTDEIYETADEADIHLEKSSASTMHGVLAVLSLTMLTLW